MTAKELAAIVGTKLQTWCPCGIIYHRGRFRSVGLRYDILLSTRIAHLAHLAFIGAGTEWLAKRSCSLHFWDDLWRVRLPRTNTGAPADDDPLYTWTANFQDPLSAIVAAIRSCEKESA